MEQPTQDLDRITRIQMKCDAIGAATGTTITISSLGSKTPRGTLSITDNVTTKRFFYVLPDVEECLEKEEETVLYVRASMDKRNLRR